MDWTTRLTQALDYLEDNPEGTADIEKAAGLANCSLFHFCRMFEVVFSVSPAEYLRRRRLSRAALDIAAGRDKVIDVALRYGWDSPESFTKAFKRCFGITPSEAKAGSAQLEIWPHIRLAVVLKGDRTMKYRIEERAQAEFVGLPIRTTNTENENLKTIPRFWETKGKDGTLGVMARYCGKLGLLGVCYDYNPADNSFAYAIAIEKGDFPMSALPAGCETIEVPASVFAVFESRDPHARRDSEAVEGHLCRLVSLIGLRARRHSRLRILSRAGPARASGRQPRVPHRSVDSPEAQKNVLARGRAPRGDLPQPRRPGVQWRLERRMLNERPRTRA